MSLKIYTQPKRLGRVGAAFAAAGMLVPPPILAAESGLLAPICANGQIYFVRLDIDDDGENKDAPQQNGACHGPCAPARKAMLKDKTTPTR